MSTSVAALREILVEVTQAYADEAARRGELEPVRIAELIGRRDEPGEDFRVRVADAFAAAPQRRLTTAVHAGYARLKAENLRLLRRAADAGVRIRPWRGRGQPYAGSAEMISEVARTGVLHVFLTESGHGPGPADPGHPLCEPSEVRVDGFRLLHNDVFRAVHDIFGHAMSGAAMGPVGELRAARCHMALYSAVAHPVLFTEQVAQICWFFYGPHLRDASGRLPRPDEPGWIPPPARPYPPQKVFPCPPGLLQEFRAGLPKEDR
ncbi:crotonobetainyl-CoA--carnitine CoA-transferase [Micromonospora sp. NPDC003776]